MMLNVKLGIMMIRKAVSKKVQRCSEETRLPFKAPSRFKRFQYRYIPVSF